MENDLVGGIGPIGKTQKKLSSYQASPLEGDKLLLPFDLLL